MLRPGTQNDYINARVNLPTAKSHAEIVRDLEPKIKAQAFFSARVAEAHILERLRSVTDAYSRGEMGLGEARNRLKEFLQAQGYDPRQATLRNLAGTARLNLILKQNAAMTNAAAEWKRMHDPDAMKVFPYVRYHARSDRKTRSAHSDLDGKIFHKDDPFLRTHSPPWEFNCRCYLEEITEKEALRHSAMIQTPTPADKVTIDSDSGFVFDPEHAFEEFDLEAVKKAGMMGKVREEAEIEFGSQITFKNNKASFEDKKFHTFEDEGRGSALSWKNENLPQAPAEYSVEKAKEMLQAGTQIKAATGVTVTFDNECLQHWQEETKKNEKEINARLAFMPMAISTITAPLEVWNQGTQMGFIKAFQKSTGGFRGCLVFVMTETSKVRTYFLKDLKALDKARKGFSVQIFDS